MLRLSIAFLIVFFGVASGIYFFSERMSQPNTAEIYYSAHYSKVIGDQDSDVEFFKDVLVLRGGSILYKRFLHSGEALISTELNVIAEHEDMVMAEVEIEYNSAAFNFSSENDLFLRKIWPGTYQDGQFVQLRFFRPETGYLCLIDDGFGVVRCFNSIDVGSRKVGKALREKI